MWESSKDDVRPAFAEGEREIAAAHCGGGTPLALRDLWGELRGGRFRVVDTFSRDQQCYLVLSAMPPEGSGRRRLNARRFEIAERVFGGQAQKVVAHDLQRSPSTITAALSESLTYLGLNCRGSRAPILVVMAAHAAAAASSSLQARSAECVIGGVPYVVVGAPRPDIRLSSLLTAAECEAARLLLDGNSHFDIARIRGASARTIANQLGSAFIKVGASGRAQLLSLLIRSDESDPGGATTLALS